MRNVERDAPFELVNRLRAVLAIGQNSDVSTRAAHVERDGVPALCEPGVELSADDAAGEPRVEDLCSSAGGAFGRHLTAVRLHDGKRVDVPAFCHLGAELTHEASEERLHISVCDHCRGALILSPHRTDHALETDTGMSGNSEVRNSAACAS